MPADGSLATEAIKFTFIITIWNMETNNPSKTNMQSKTEE